MGYIYPAVGYDNFALQGKGLGQPYIAVSYNILVARV